MVTSGGIALSDTEKTEALAESMDVQFQRVSVYSVPILIEMVYVALELYFQTRASEPKLTDHEEYHEATRGLKLGAVPGPKSIPITALKYLSKRAVSLLVHIFNAVLRTHHPPPVISVLNPG